MIIFGQDDLPALLDKPAELVFGGIAEVFSPFAALHMGCQLAPRLQFRQMAQQGVYTRKIGMHKVPQQGAVVVDGPPADLHYGAGIQPCVKVEKRAARAFIAMLHRPKRAAQTLQIRQRAGMHAVGAKPGRS